MAINADRAVEMALKELIVAGSEAPIEAVDAQDAVLYMNLMMNAFSADGINLGYTNISDLGDEITVPDGALLGVIKNLAVFLATQYGVTVTTELFLAAKGSLNTMRNISVKILSSNYPDTLPIGSGNENDTYNSDFHFYPTTDDQVATEQDGPILLEDETV